MNQEEFSFLVTRKLSGEASDEELRQLERMIATENEYAARYNYMLQYWNVHENGNNGDVESSLNKLLARMDAPVVSITKRKSYRWIAAASIAAILAGVTAVFFFKTNNTLTSDNIALVEKTNSKGTKSVLELSDGTKIWLNADSKLQYPDVFNGKTREVTLNGEAFFDVAKNAAKPFIINLSSGTVKVLGTSFNIRAYDNENRMETSVATGKVAFIPRYHNPKKKQDTLFITPDKKLKYIYAAEELVIQPSSALEDKAWTEGKLIFKSMSWEEIALELERNFGKKIVFVDEEIKQYKLTGSFQDNSLDEILYYLAKTADFTYEIRDHDVKIFYSNNKQ
jgi:ferric-dicitrate binding protein FerR (iron transport regulator)